MESVSSKNKLSYWQVQGCHFVRFDINSSNPIVIDKNFHDEISIIAFTRSAWSSRQNNQSFNETPDSVVIRDAGQAYSARSNAIHQKGAVCRELRICPQHLQTMYESLGLKTPTIDFSKPSIANRYLHMQVMNIHAELESVTCNLEATSKLSMLINTIVQHANHQENVSLSKQKHYIKSAIDYLREHYSVQVSLQELADTTRCNPFVLLRQFKKEVGLTPHEYLHAYRIAKAKSSIRKGLPLIEVAYACGFSDQSHLTRLFKRKVGVTPGQFIVNSIE